MKQLHRPWLKTAEAGALTRATPASHHPLSRGRQPHCIMAAECQSSARTAILGSRHLAQRSLDLVHRICAPAPVSPSRRLTIPSTSCTIWYGQSPLKRTIPSSCTIPSTTSSPPPHPPSTISAEATRNRRESEGLPPHPSKQRTHRRQPAPRRREAAPCAPRPTPRLGGLLIGGYGAAHLDDE